MQTQFRVELIKPGFKKESWEYFTYASAVLKADRLAATHNSSWRDVGDVNGMGVLVVRSVK